MKLYYICTSCEKLVPALEFCKCFHGQEKKQERQDFNEALKELNREFPGFINANPLRYLEER